MIFEHVLHDTFKLAMIVSVIVHGLYLGSCVCEKVARWFGIPVSSNGPLKKPASLSYVTVHLWSR